VTKKKQTQTPLSGDRLIDTLFRVILDTLNREIEAIRVKKVLRNSSRKELFGLLTEGKIYLGKRMHASQKHPLVAGLIHELLHAAFEDSVSERRILALENILLCRLTDAQKRHLRRYIPTHEVKKDPK